MFDSPLGWCLALFHQVLVGDLGVQVQGWSLETLFCGVVSFDKLEGKVLVEILFLSFQEDL